MNDVVRDWMLVKSKRPAKPVPKPVVEPSKLEPVRDQSNKKMSKMEQRLLGVNYM